MSKRTKWIIGLVSLIAMIAILAPVCFYVKDFHDLPRSSNPSDWGTFGDFLGGVLNPIISLLTLIVTTIIAVYISKIEKRNHDETVHTPVKPLITIETGDFFSSDTSEIGHSIDEDFFDYTPPKVPASPHDHFSKQFYLKLSNKGLGIATQVSVTFEIDLIELNRILQIDDPKIKVTSSSIRTDEDGRDFIILNINAGLFNQYVSFFKIFKTERYGLGIIDKEEEVKAEIPIPIMNAFQLFNQLRRLTSIDGDFPTISVTFNYKNIHDKALTSRFRIGLYHIHDYERYSMFRILQDQIE